MSNPVLIIDNGAATIKCGLASSESPNIIPNCKMKVKSERQRQYIGDQIDDCKDCSGLYYILPHQKGFIMNWDTQREVWDYVINSKYKHIDPKETQLIITEPYFNFKQIQNNIDEVLFEEFGFASVLRTNTGFLSCFNSKVDTPACLVVDSGFSFTHIAPYICSEKSKFMKLKHGVRRVDVGGKLLTNHLKDIISYRQMNVMDETYVINQCKEDVCFVSTKFHEELKTCEQKKRNNIVTDYILPDYTNVKRGYAKEPNWRANRLNPNPDDPQFVRLANERFQVPELLFNPSDIGINQVGIVEAIVDSISSLPEKIQPLLYSNIVLTGGNANIRGFKARLAKDLRIYCPSLYDLNVNLPKNPTTYPWFGGKELGSHDDLLKKLSVTKKEYDESGDNKRSICVDKFDT
uniref:Actin-related protein 6 n=1 Tax=Aceria tosichella TaxID=561515 RepID=A0A6G1SDJ2_9ACAR